MGTASELVTAEEPKLESSMPDRGDVSWSCQRQVSHRRNQVSVAHIYMLVLSYRNGSAVGTGEVGSLGDDVQGHLGWGTMTAFVNGLFFTCPYFPTNILPCS